MICEGRFKGFIEGSEGFGKGRFASGVITDNRQEVVSRYVRSWDM